MKPSQAGSTDLPFSRENTNDSNEDNSEEATSAALCAFVSLLEPQVATAPLQTNHFHTPALRPNGGKKGGLKHHTLHFFTLYNQHSI